MSLDTVWRGFMDRGNKSNRCSGTSEVLSSHMLMLWQLVGRTLLVPTSREESWMGLECCWVNLHIQGPINVLPLFKA